MFGRANPTYHEGFTFATKPKETLLIKGSDLSIADANLFFSGALPVASGDVDGDGLDDIGFGGDNSQYLSKVFYVLVGGLLFDDRQIKPSELGGAVVATAKEGDILVGDHRANALSKLGTGDSANAGTGDDSIEIDSTDFIRVRGGRGEDRLVFADGDKTLDFTDFTRTSARVEGIEVIDLSGEGDHEITLSELAVYALTEQRANFGGNNGVASILVRGESDDTLTLKEGIGDGADMWTRSMVTLDLLGFGGRDYAEYTLDHARVLVDSVTVA